MNIAILIPKLATGGAERAATELGNHYYNRGDKVFFFLLANSGRSFFDVSGEVIKTHITYPFDQSSNRVIVRETFFAAKSLKEIKRNYKIDVCISFMEGCNVLNVLSRIRGERIIISVRTILSERREYDGLFLYNKRLIKNVYRFADKIVSVSDSVKNDLISSYGISPKKIQTIPNVSRNLKVEAATGSDEAEKWIYGDKTVVCVGRMDPVKQFDSVLRAFSTIISKDPAARLIFVGDGKQMNRMKILRKRLQLEEKVSFVGFQKNVGGFLKNAKCFVMASKAEGFPNAMVEAMACGVPIVSIDSPGGCGEILGREQCIRGVERCEFGIMTPYIKRESCEETDPSFEEKLLGEAIYEMLNEEDLNVWYSQKSVERSKYYSEGNVMKMWDKIVGEKE